jgi:hypothetical protein
MQKASPIPARVDAPSERALAPTPLRPPSRSQTLLHEPLLHFVALGALLFAIDHALVARTDDPRTIVVGAAVDQEAISAFQGSRGRPPDDKELAALRQVWLDNEVLYRVGSALQVDKGDETIRDRVIFKVLGTIDTTLKLPQIEDQELRAWFESHRDKYDEPARYDFEEAALASAGKPSEATVRAFVDALNAGASPDVEAGLRVFKGRPHANLLQSYGADFAHDLAATPPGQWRAFDTRDGWRAMRLDSITPPKPADYEALRNVVLGDWTDATASELRTSAVRALTKKYNVIYEPKLR